MSNIQFAVICILGSSIATSLMFIAHHLYAIMLHLEAIRSSAHR